MAGASPWRFGTLHMTMDTTNETTPAQGQVRVLSNTTYLLAASLIQKFLSLGYTVYYFRTLGRHGTGDFEPVRSAIPIVLLLVDFSLSTVLTREVSRAPEHARKFLGNVLTVKLLLAVLSLAIISVLYSSSIFDAPTKQLIPVAGLVIALDMFTMAFTATLRGVQIFRYEAIGIVLTQMATVSFGFMSFALHWGLRGLMFSLVAGSAVNFTYMLSVLTRRIGGFPRLAWNRDVIRRFLIVALPILGAAALAKVFTYSDRYLLLRFADKSAFAVYTAAHKAPFALEFIASAFAASLLPAMSNYFIHSHEQLRRIFSQALRYLLLISVPIAVGLFVLAQPFIVKLFGKSYVDAVTPLRIMILALPFIFLNFPVGSFLIATNRQIWNTINLAVAVAVNIALNLLLQPRLGVSGAAIAVLVTYVLVFSLGLLQASRVVKLKGREISFVFFQALLAAAIMALPVGLLQRTFSPYFLIIPGGILYVASLFILGAFNRDDLQLLLRALGRKPEP